MKIYIWLIFISFVLSSNIFGSNEYSVEVINPSSELPVSDISKIYFGQKGLLWIGTNKGLFYYDGYSYNSLISLFFNTNTLSDDNILDITQNESGEIWLLTKYGIEKFNIHDRKPETVFYMPYTLAKRDILHALNDSVLYITSDNLILKFNTRLKLIDTLFVSESTLKCLPVLNHEFLWIVDKEELNIINLHDNSIEKVKFSPFLTAKSIVLQYYKNNSLLISINNKLFIYNSSSKHFFEIVKLTNDIFHLSDVHGNKIIIATNNEVFICEFIDSSICDVELLETISDATINNIAIDNNDFAWIATNKAILSINPYSKEFKYESFLQDEFNYSNDSDIIFESSKKGIVFKAGKNKYTFRNTTNNIDYSLPITECTAACLYDDELFVGLHNKLIKYDLSNNIETNIYQGIYVNAIKTLDESLWVATDQGLFLYNDDSLSVICNTAVWDFIVKDNAFYIITEGGFGRISRISCQYELIIPGKSIKADSRLNDILQSYDGKTWIATDNGLFQFLPDSTKNIEDQFKLHYNGAVYALIEAPELPEIWFSTDIGLGAIDYRTNEDMFFGYADGVHQLPYLVKGAYLDKNNNVVFVSRNEIVKFKPEQIFRRKTPPEVIISIARLISKNEIEEQLLYRSDTLIVLPHIRYLELELTTFDYFSPKSTRYEYSLEPIGSALNWRSINDKNKLSIGRLSAGKYELKIKAVNNHGIESKKYRNLLVIVKAPLLQSRWAYFIYFITITFMVFLLIRIRTRNLRRVNREYKEKELIAKKVELQKEELSLKNKNITDSINYARRIQLAMMPSTKLFTAVFPDSFVLHMPKDIVSGDFYWINQVEDKTFFSAVDCTGHGVPGAFMSIIGVELFRRITEIEGISTPAEVLNSLSKNFERVFGDVDEMKLRDGMDLAFCSLNADNTVLEFAGAFNPLYIIRDSSIMEIKGDRHSVGIYEEDDNVRSFNNHVIPLQEGDIIYIFTDGFSDQFGGHEGKKYKYRRFRHLLLALHQLPMEKQRDFLRNSILEWKGELEQVDDILVMGLRIHQKNQKK